MSTYPWGIAPERSDLDGSEDPPAGVEAGGDFTVEDHGSVTIVQPLSSACREWLAEHTDGQWWAGGLAVEPRYLDTLVTGLWEAGFTYRG